MGNAVDTTDAKPSEFITNLYTSSFAGTSSASPIIAGAAASIQGIAKIIREKYIHQASLGIF